MEFTCAHCGKTITCSARLIDGNFLHSTCEAAFTLNKMKELRLKTVNKWKTSGLLDGLTGLGKG